MIHSAEIHVTFLPSRGTYQASCEGWKAQHASGAQFAAEAVAAKAFSGSLTSKISVSKIKELAGWKSLFRGFAPEAAIPKAVTA